MYREYKDKVRFYLVYVREAHPEDGWQVGANKRDNVIYETPKSVAERAKIAGDCVKELKLEMPCLLDDMKDTVQTTWRGWPARAALVGQDGKIVYLSPSAPTGVNPPEIRMALRRMLENSEDRSQESEVSSQKK